MTKCDDCHTPLSSSDWFCPHCGRPREECPQCGSHVPPNRKNCSTCGQPRMAPCSDCGRLIELGSEECSRCGHSPGQSRKKYGKWTMIAGVVVGLGVPGAILLTQDGFLMTVVAFLIALVTVPLMGLLIVGGGLLGTSGEMATPASVKLGKRQNRSEPLRVDVSRPDIPNACPDCGDTWKREQFGEKVQTVGYESFKEDQAQCLNCGHIYRNI